MGLFSSRMARQTARLVLDVGPASVAGACVLYPSGSAPVICYSKRAPITPNPEEQPLAAMERTFALVADALAKEGRPALARTARGATLAGILVAIDAPWQWTTVHTQERRAETPFTFTKRVLAQILAEAKSAFAEGPDRVVGEHVTSVWLNGYETRQPFGKSAKRASVTLLVSQIDTAAIEAIGSVLKERFGAPAPRYVSGPALRYRTLVATFLHEANIIILDAAGHAAALSLVRGGALAAIREFPGGAGEAAWAAAVKAALVEIAASYPLPRTILLVTDKGEVEARTAALQGAGLGTLWLSDRPPKIVPVTGLPKERVTASTEALPDTHLALMALYAGSTAAED